MTMSKNFVTEHTARVVLAALEAVPGQRLADRLGVTPETLEAYHARPDSMPPGRTLALAVFLGRAFDSDRVVQIASPEAGTIAVALRDDAWRRFFGLAGAALDDAHGPIVVASLLGSAIDGDDVASEQLRITALTIDQMAGALGMTFREALETIQPPTFEV